MAIYTRSGDGGKTGLPSGRRLRKDSPVVEALGTIDELNSVIGTLDVALENIQGDLMVLASKIAWSPKDKRQKVWDKRLEKSTRKMEGDIDKMQKKLPKLHSFILPRGQIHVARAVCRRAERAVVKIKSVTQLPGNTIKYLNRLSDYLFVLARWEQK